MFERFTDSARRVIVLAQKESGTLGHDRIGAEHLLLGLAHADTGPACVVLGSFGLTLADARSAAAAAAADVGESEPTSRGHIRFTRRARRVLETALRESLLLRHPGVSSGHLLLGLLAEHEGVAADILTRLDIDPEEARRRVLAAIAAAPESPPPETAPQPWSAIARANARAREIAVQLSQARTAKDAALGAGDLVGATALRERERALLAERVRLAADLHPHPGTPPPSGPPD